MDGLREKQADQATAATETKAAGTETSAPSGVEPWTVIGVPINSGLANEFSTCLQAYGRACSDVKAALLKHGTEPELYMQKRAIKEGCFTACMSVFDRVLAHIGVRAP